MFLTLLAKLTKYFEQFCLRSDFDGLAALVADGRFSFKSWIDQFKLITAEAHGLKVDTIQAGDRERPLDVLAPALAAIEYNDARAA